MEKQLLTAIPFSGFYETWHDQVIKDELDGLFQNDQGEIVDEPEDFYRHYNYKAMMKAYSERYLLAFKDKLMEEGIELPSLTFESIQSPKEYNFTTDRIFAHISPEDVAKLLLSLGREELEKAIKERFTSRDGFISHYSNDINDWLTKAIGEYDHNEIETLIQAAMNAAGIEDSQLEGCELLDRDRGNGVISSLVWDNLTPEGVRLANEWSEKHRPNGEWKD